MRLERQSRPDDGSDALQVARYGRVLIQEFGWAIVIAAVGATGSGFTEAAVINFGIGAVIGYWQPLSRRQALGVSTLSELPDRSRVATPWFTAMWALFDVFIATVLALTVAGLFFEPYGAVFGGAGLGLAGRNLRTFWVIRRAETTSGGHVFMVIRGPWYAVGRRSFGTWYRKSSQGPAPD